MTQQALDARDQHEDTAPAVPRIWLVVLLVFASGVAAAMQLGKLAQLMPFMRAELALSKVAAGWTVSLIAVLSAALGISAGSLVRGFGLKRALVTGLAILTLGGLLSPLAAGAASLLGTRFVEGIGYLLVVVSAPALITALSDGRVRAIALSLWACFVVLGFALAGAAHSVLAPLLSWRAELVAFAGLTAMLAVLVGTTVPSSVAERRRSLAEFLRDHAEALRETKALRLATVFGLYVVLAIGFHTYLPTLLVEEHGASAALSGRIAALAGLAAVPGTMVTATFLRRGVSSVRIGGAGVVAVIVLGAAAYRADGIVGLAALSIAYSLANGVVGAACFATIPRLVTDPSRTALGFGLMAVLGGLGTLLAPPVAGWTIEKGGWEAMPYLFTGIGLTALLMLATLRGAARRG